MKKMVVSLLTSAMILSLAGCGGGEVSADTTQGMSKQEAGANPDSVDLKELAANASDEIKVSVWGRDSVGDDESSRGLQVKKMAEEFSAMYDNVTVEYFDQGDYSEVQEKVLAAGAAHDLPTVFATEESMVKGFESIAANALDYIPSSTIEDYQQGLLVSMYSEEGKLLGVPFARSLPVLIVNKEILKESGWKGQDIKTVDDMMECAKAIYTTCKIPGFAIFWDNDCWHWESAVYADGGAVLTEDGTKPAFGKDYDYVGAEYANKIKTGLMEGYVISPYTSPNAYDQISSMFCEGKLGMMVLSCNDMPNRAKSAEEKGYTLEAYVQPAGKEGISVSSGGSNWILCEDASYEEKMFAGAFLSYIAQVEQVMRFTKGSGSMMITTSAMESEEGKKLLEEHPYFKATYDTIPYLHERPNTSFWTEMYTYAADKLEQFSLNPAETDVEAMVDDFEKKFQQIIDDNAW